jgi:hypothetical protein
MLAVIADRLFLYIFVVLTVLLLGGIINQAPNAKFI